MLFPPHEWNSSNAPKANGYADLTARDTPTGHASEP